MRSGLWLSLLAGVTAVAGVLSSLHLRARMIESEIADVRLSAETLRLNTEQEIALFAEVLASIGALHALSDEVSPPAMAEFVEKGMVHQHAVLGSFGLAQRITPAVRAALEEAVRHSPESGYRVTERGPEGEWVAVRPRSVYYPLTWQSRDQALGVPIGYDFLSCETAREAIERMARTREPVVTRLPVAEGDTGWDGYWVFAPIEAGRGPVSRVLLGFSAAVLYPQAIIERVLSLSVPVQGVRVRLDSGMPEDGLEGLIERIDGAWLYRHPVQVVDRWWIFECMLPPEVGGGRATAALLAGLVITFLLTAQLLVLAGRTRRIENEVRVRTADLRTAKARLEDTLRERRRLEEEMQELAASERRRLGRDLHDSLGQKLTGAVFLSRSLLGRFAEAGGEAAGHARTLNETLKSAVNQVRSMARGLAPVSLHDEELDGALEQLATEMTSLYGVSCEVSDPSGASGLNRAEKEQVYLIAREAVNNAARHAGARRVSVSLTEGLPGWRLLIEDDGKGVPQGGPVGGGMGIRIMRNRAQMIGAEFSMEPVAGGGTCVRVEKRGGTGVEQEDGDGGKE